jgi:hypothetical protein
MGLDYVVVDLCHLSTSSNDMQALADRLSGAGRVGLDGTIDLPARLQIDAVLSEAIIASVKELQALTDDQGRVMLPLAIRGRAPQIAVLPDLRYVASRVVATKATEFLGELLAPRETEDASEAAPESQPSDADTARRWLRQLLPADRGSEPEQPQ